MKAWSSCHSWSFTRVWTSAISRFPGAPFHWTQPGYLTCFQRPSRTR
jgi:hypothetical protein